MVKLLLDGRSNSATAIVFIVVDLVAVVLRIISKRRTKKWLGSDDGWILGALGLFFVWAVLVIYACFLQGTLEPKFLYYHNIEPEDASKVFKYIWIADSIFFPTITAVKISILTFYRRIFLTKKFGIITHIITALCVMWMIAGIVFNIWGCLPIEANYVVTYGTLTYCHPFGIFVFLMELLNSLLDVAILSMPAFVIRRLQMSPAQKYQAMGVFLMGGFVLITCVLRMVYTFIPDNFYMIQSFPGRIVWSTVELGVAIVCACLPTYRPLIPKSLGLSGSVKSWYFSFYKITRSHRSASNKQHGYPKEDGLMDPSAEYIDLERGGRAGGAKGGQARGAVEIDKSLPESPPITLSSIP